MNIDDIDILILKELTKNSRASLSVISSKVNLSIPAVSERIRKLEENGYINQYTTILNMKKFNYSLICFSFISLRYEENGIKRFRDFVENNTNILECHLITGQYEYLLKIIVKEPKDLEEILSSLRSVADVLTSSTSISISSLKDQTSFL